MDQHTRASGSGSPPSVPSTTALVRELVEALTALGNYLAAANHGSGEIIEKSLGQYERAADAARRLRDLLCCDDSAKEDSLPGFR